jgi:hypothetical protein
MRYQPNSGHPKYILEVIANQWVTKIEMQPKKR